jgi:hypothetical protein
MIVSNIGITPDLIAELDAVRGKYARPRKGRGVQGVDAHLQMEIPWCLTKGKGISVLCRRPGGLRKIVPGS